MMEVLSQRLRERLEFGKYVRWTKRQSAESLQSLLLAVFVFGREYGAASRARGTDLTPTFAPSMGDETRMDMALRVLAAVQAGPLDPERGFSSKGFDDPQPAFLEPFRKVLGADDTLGWSSSLDERQVWSLLWAVGEYGIRANSSRGEGGEDYPPPVFGVEPSSESLMRNALRVVAAVERGDTIDILAAKRMIGGGGV